ncbi:hypothetical protein RDABS01_019777 [Bienertia sinuspersici]
MKAIVSILKDNLSIIKATLLLSSKPTTSLHVAVLRATTHRHQEDPPPVDAVLALAHHHRPSTAGVLIHALLRRVHGTHNVYVALKCLVTIHHAITRGSPALKDHILGTPLGPSLIFPVSSTALIVTRGSCLNGYGGTPMYWIMALPYHGEMKTEQRRN